MSDYVSEEPIPKPGGRSSRRGVKIAAAIVLIVLFGLVFYLYTIQEKPNGTVPSSPQNILDTQEARSWISSCEVGNPYIKHKCTDLFYYEYALENSDENICSLITDEGIKENCMVYFKLK